MALGWLSFSKLFTIKVWGAVSCRFFPMHLLYLVLRRILFPFGEFFVTRCMARVTDGGDGYCFWDDLCGHTLRQPFLVEVPPGRHVRCIS